MANIFVYGGCVSRDTFEYLKEEHALVQYVARQSLISADSRQTRTLRTNHLTDGFQDRSVIGDINSSLYRLIESKQSKTDILLFDILSERLGTYRIPGGTFITKSVELAKTKLIGTLEKPAATIAFGTDRHFDLWKTAVANFASLLKKHELFERALFIEAPWAEETVNGESVPRFRGWTAANANEMYSRYYAHLRSEGFASRTIPSEFGLSTDNHKWGPAPYHYQDEAYLWLKGEVSTFIERSIG